MIRLFFLALLIGFAFLAGGSRCAEAADSDLAVQHIRNATLKLTSGDTTFLVDPMLSEAGAYDGFQGTHRSWLRNPLTTAAYVSKRYCGWG